MGQLYRKAEQVIVWLGERDETTTLALETMKTIFKSCCTELYGPATVEDCVMKLSNDADWYALREKTMKTAVPNWPEDPETCAKALQQFFKRPWFSRIWVIQEVRDSQNIVVQIAETTLAWSIITVTAAWVVYAPSPVTHINEPYKFGGFLHADLMQQKLFTTQDDVPFLEVLDRCRSFKSSIPTDRIFALLQYPAARIQEVENSRDPTTRITYPLNSQKNPFASHFKIKVDYDLSLLEVYRQIVIRSISEGSSLQVLSHAIEDQDKRKGYPSWMPVWHATSSRFTGPRRTYLFNASRGYGPQLSTYTDPSLIGLRGLVIGMVTGTNVNIKLQARKSQRHDSFGIVTTRTRIRDTARLIVRDCWQPEHNWLQDKVCRTGSYKDAHFQDFCAYMTERLTKFSGPALISLHGKWCDICVERHVVTPAIDPNENLEILHCETCPDFDMCLACHSSGHTCPGQHTLFPRPIPSMVCDLDEDVKSMLRSEQGNGNSGRFDLGVRQSFDQQSFITLDNGLLGIGSEITCINDLVVVFFGGRVPFLLRQNDSFFSLLGECYLHGFMDGEAIDAWHKGQLGEEPFIII